MREEYGSMTNGGHKSRFIVLLASFHSYHFVFTCLYLHFLKILHLAAFHHIQRSLLFQYCSTADKAKWGWFMRTVENALRLLYHFLYFHRIMSIWKDMSRWHLYAIEHTDSLVLPHMFDRRYHRQNWLYGNVDRNNAQAFLQTIGNTQPWQSVPARPRVQSY